MPAGCWSLIWVSVWALATAGLLTLDFGGYTLTLSGGVVQGRFLGSQVRRA